MNKITIYGRIPSLKNSKIMVCRGRVPMLLPSLKYKEWHKDASLQLLGVQKIPCSVPVKATFFVPDARKGDLSNKWESVGDLLVDNEIIEDDNWTVIGDLRLVYGGIDRDKPRVEIEY